MWGEGLLGDTVYQKNKGEGEFVPKAEKACDKKPREMTEEKKLDINQPEGKGNKRINCRPQSATNCQKKWKTMSERFGGSPEKRCQKHVKVGGDPHQPPNT